MAGARTLLQNLTPRGRIVLAASALGILVLAFLMIRMATQPSYSTLVSGLDPADTGKMTKALDEHGIAYELQNNGTALAVDKSQVPKARIALAEGGLTGGDKPGFELFDEQKLGASDFQQQVTYQRALEGEIARTIGQVEGVSGTQVQLTLPEDQLFTDEAKPATAAVLLQSGGTSLDPAAVRGIARLVSSSVEGLKPSNVTITDQSGQLLWPNGDGGDGGMTAGNKQAAEARFERELESSVNAMLLRTVGANKGQVQVQADLNADEATQDRLEYAKRGTPLRRRTEEEQLEGQGGGGGRAGADGNIPTYAQGGGAGASNYERNSEETDFGVNKTVTRTRIAPGAVNRLDVALVLDESVPASDVAAIRTAVEGATGIDDERGDTLAVSQIDFADVPEPRQSDPIGGALGSVKYVLLGLATLVFLILVGRHLRRRENDELGSAPVWLRELETPTTLSELEGAGGAAMVARPDPETAALHTEVEGFATREPDRVAQQVRAWMNEAR